MADVIKDAILDYSEVDFTEHMKEKARTWGAYMLRMGEDFAVFEFDTNEERDMVRKNLALYEANYGYTVTPGPREQLSIVKGEVKA